MPFLLKWSPIMRTSRSSKFILIHDLLSVLIKKQSNMPVACLWFWLKDWMKETCGSNLLKMKLQFFHHLHSSISLLRIYGVENLSRPLGSNWVDSNENCLWTVYVSLYLLLRSLRWSETLNDLSVEPSFKLQPRASCYNCKLVFTCLRN